MFYGLAVDPTNSKRIVWGACGDNSGVYVSNDAGASWQKKSWIGDWIYNVEITPSGTIYASGGNLYRSTDHGENFAVAGSFSGGTEQLGYSFGASMSQYTGTIIHDGNEQKKYMGTA